MISKLSGVYKIQSKSKPFRIYIGSSIDVRKRWGGHLNDLKFNKHHSKKLQNHFNKYGGGDLVFSIITSCDANDLINTEQFFIDLYNPFFNIQQNARSRLGTKGQIPWNKGKVGVSPETRAKMRIAASKRVRTYSRRLSDETKKKIGLKNKGKTRSEEEKKKMSEMRKLRGISKENRIKMINGIRNSEKIKEFKINMRGSGNHFYGKSHTDETKKTLSEKAKQRTGEEAPMFGRHHSELTKHKIREKKRGIGFSKYKGVWRCGNKWRSVIYFNKQHINLGYFTDETEAAQAYNEKANELFGEYAVLNEILISA